MNAYDNDPRMSTGEDGSWMVLPDGLGGAPWRVLPTPEEWIGGWVAQDVNGRWLLEGCHPNESVRTIFSSADEAICSLIGDPQ